MPVLALAAVVWVAVHVGLAGTSLRAMLVRQIGEPRFRAAFSVLSIAAIIFLIAAYNRAPIEPLWAVPLWLHWLLAVVMLGAFLLFAGSVTVRNPTMVGGGSDTLDEPRGMLRVTRHPMLWSFALWAAVHIIGRGTVDGVLFFGAFLVTALYGMPSIDGKLAARNPGLWAELRAKTSVLPFAAIAEGRNRLVPAEIAWFGQLIAVLVWIALLAHGHQWIFGLSPLR